MSALTPIGAASPVQPGAQPPHPAPATPAAAAAHAPAVPIWSPVPTIDVALNMVVLDFLDSHGKVTHTLPSAQQLAAYRAKGPPPAE